MNKSLESYWEMRSRRVSSIAGNSMEIKKKKVVVIEKDGNGILAYEIGRKYLGKKKI